MNIITKLNDELIRLVSPMTLTSCHLISFVPAIVKWSIIPRRSAISGKLMFTYYKGSLLNFKSSNGSLVYEIITIYVAPDEFILIKLAQ